MTLTAETDASLDDVFQSDLGRRWNELGVDASLLVETIKETQLGQFTQGSSATLDTLANAPPDPTAGDGESHASALAAPTVEIQREIGRGGMGIIREGVQSGLQRIVAVKHLHPSSDDHAVTSLLREARISGRLEHPNIVPIHALTHHEQRPAIVMKRIEGIEWSRLLEDTSLHEAYSVGDDPLRWHIIVLMRLCHAVHFAHSRHILHLDLKPANVMIGRFGETYLLDWGIAVSYSANEERPDWLPSAKDITSVVGTAAYMSPEQAAGESELLGPRSDVFQLGAMLHQVLTGKPPHESKTFALTLLNAYQAAPPEYGGDVPEELGNIARKAMARDVEERFESADALRHALAEFLNHRASTRLVAEAEERLRRLLPELRGTIDESLSALEMSDEVTIQRRMVECVFAYQQALKVWKDNTDAQRGLQEVLHLVIARAIEARDLRSAASALADLPAPAPELRRRVEQLRQDLKTERRLNKAARQVAEQVDINIHHKVRSIGAALSGVAWFLWHSVLGWGVHSGWWPLDYDTLFINLAASTVSSAGATFLLRKTLLQTRINRQAMAVLWGGFASTWALWGSAAVLGIPPIHGLALLSVLFVFFLAIAVSLDRRLWLTAIPGMPAVALSILDIEHVFEWQATAGLVAGLSIAWIWRKPGTR